MSADRDGRVYVGDLRGFVREVVRAVCVIDNDV
jgi:hypothetical protein